MTGESFLNFLCGTSGRIGMLDCNIDDTEYRGLVLQWLNLVIKDIAGRQQDWHYRFLEKTVTASTVADQLDYDLPTDIDGYKVFSVLDRTHNHTYRFCPHDKFLRFVPNPSLSTGAPYLYTVWAGNLKLWPVPSSVFTIYLKYVKTLTALADDSNSTEIPAKYDSVVIDGVLVWAYKFDPQLGNADNQARIYEWGAGGAPGMPTGGVQGLVLDNRININELGSSQSHRSRRREFQTPYPIEE